MPATDPAKRLARELHDLARRVRSVERADPTYRRDLPVERLITGEIAAGERIIAGPEGGTHAEMTASGFRVFAEDSVDGVPNEVVRLGDSDTNDFLAVTGADGTIVAAIDETGRASFRSLNIQADLTIGGETLLGNILGNGPKGVVAQGIGIPNQSGILAEANLFGVRWTAEAGRHYRVTVTGLRWANSATGFGSGATFLLRDGVIGTELGRAEYLNGAVGWNSGHSFILDIRGGITAGEHFYVLSVAAAGSSLHAQYSSVQPYMMVIEDLGAVVGESGQTFAIATPEPARTVYQETHAASWSQAYVGSGGVMSNSGGRLYQGQDPSGYNGNQKSLIGFPDLTAKLAGATVNKIELFLYAGHWYNNAGGTAVIGAHGLTGVPATFAGAIDPNRMQSGSWPKPGSRVVDITSWASGFKDGSVRGVVLGPGPTTSTEFYGYFNGAGQAYAPELRINYTK